MNTIRKWVNHFPMNNSLRGECTGLMENFSLYLKDKKYIPSLCHCPEFHCLPYTWTQPVRPLKKVTLITLIEYDSKMPCIRHLMCICQINVYSSLKRLHFLSRNCVQYFSQLLSWIIGKQYFKNEMPSWRHTGDMWRYVCNDSLNC